MRCAATAAERKRAACRPTCCSGCPVTIPAPVAEARAALARQLASWRQAAGFTQAQTGYRIGYSRSAIARAETTGVCSRDFCTLAGRLYGAGDALALMHDRIEGLAAAGRAQAARQARRVTRHRRPRDERLASRPAGRGP
jgi:hypothetical protein